MKAQAQSLFGDSNVHCLGQKFITWGQEKSNLLHGSTQVVNIHYLGQNTDVPDQIGALSQVGTKKISKGGWTI